MRSLRARQDLTTYGGSMKKAELTLPEIALIAGTRGMLGAGAALLLADRLSAETGLKAHEGK
jgi:hypothetical protein